MAMLDFWVAIVGTIMNFLHRSQIVFALSLGFIFGVVFVFLDVFSFRTTIFWCSLFVFVIVLTHYRHGWAILSSIWILGFLIGFAYTKEHLKGIDDYHRSGEVITAQATVVSEPRRSTRFLNVEAQYDEGLRVLARAPKHDLIVLGDRLLLGCTLEAPETFDGFNYPRYLSMRGVQYICKDPKISVSGHNQSFLAQLAAFRRAIESGVTLSMRSPESGLANGLLFGGNDRLSDELQDAFSRTGMSHITAVSGYNVSVIIMVITLVGIRFGLWRKQAAVVSLVAIVLFVAMIGFPSSGVRAAIMGSLVLGALLYGRVSQMIGAVVLACAAMLLWNPLQIVYDVGFQLSFGAVLGIMAFFPLLERYLVWRDKTPFLIEVIFMTISAQLFVLPFIAYHFQTFSAASLVTNLLVLPVLPFTMFFVFLCALFYQILPILAVPFAMVAQGLLTYEIAVIEFFAAQSWSAVEIENFSWPFTFIYYTVLLGVIWWFLYKGWYGDRI